MITPEYIEKIYNKALSKVKDKPGKVARVHSGVYLLCDRNLKIWQVNQLDETPGKPWLAFNYYNEYNEYTDYYETKKDCLAALMEIEP